MKSGKFWAGLALSLVLGCASFAFGEGAGRSRTIYVGSTSNLPATLLIALAPGGNLHRAKPANGGWGGGGGGWGGGGGGCGQGGNGGWNSTGNGWGGGGGNGGGGNGGCGVPEGGNSLEYLAIGALACLAAMVYRAYRPAEVR